MLSSKVQPDFLAGGGAIEALIRAKDWSQTPLGPIVAWPQSLKTSLRVVLDSRYPMFIWWGEELTVLYNEAYAQMTLAIKHPWALGRSASEVWAESWNFLGPRADEVIHKGKATWDEELMLVLERSGFPEETYHTFSYSPIPNDDGGVGGLICPVTEETKQVLSRRRLRTLRELSMRTTVEEKTVEGACRMAIQILAENPNDLSFALIYLLENEQKIAKLAGATGLPEGSPARPTGVDLSVPNETTWPLWMSLEAMQATLVVDLRNRFGALPKNIWPDPPDRALILPIKSASQVELAGFLVSGLSPRLALDDEYRGFLEITAGQIGTALANAQAYEAERQRAEALAELDRVKTTFFNNISHEFRTPLTLMLGPLVESLAEAQAPAERERLELIYRNGLRLQKLVNTLLDFSRIEAGRLKGLYEPTDLATLTSDLASTFRSAIERVGLRLLVDCFPLSELIYIDRDKWEQIVLNLLSNALKFTLDGEIEVALRDVGDKVQLTVRDTGSGIREDHLPHIFERFHRVEGTRARSLEGTGIGLAFVSELVKLHGGNVDVASVYGEGSTFTVTLPKGKAHLPADQIRDEIAPFSNPLQASQYVEEALRWLPNGDVEATDALNFAEDTRSLVKPDSATRKARLVLADDNADMRDYVRRLLANRYEVEAVADGLTALAAVRQQLPDLLLADVMMPGLDGFALLHEIRADEQLKTLPVIMLSARAGEEAKIEGLDAGADEYLIKPFSARELLARISAQLELAGVRREAMSALRQRAEEFNAHFNLTAVGNVQADAKSGRLLLVNSAICEMLGYSEAELLERTIWEITVPQDRAANQVLFDELVRGDLTSFELEKRFARKDGEVRWGLISVTIAQRDEEGNALRTGSVVLDITRRKHAEEEMLNLNETLERRVEERTAQVRQAEADRERLARSLMMAEQVERRRISQVLHDDLQQLLYATQMHFALLSSELESIVDKRLVDELNEAKSWLRQSIETTRQMTVDLSPPILRTEGLAAALEWLQPQMEQRHGLKIVINIEESFSRENTRLTDEDLRALLFQIVRELLFNVAKHAGVDRAVVTLAREDNWMVIHVIDEGRGFDTENIAEHKEQKGGFGLFSVSERLNLVGGRMEVYSQPGAGTHIVIFVPLQAEQNG